MEILLSLTRRPVSSRARRGGNEDVGSGSGASDFKSESYAFLARRTWETLAQESELIFEKSIDFDARS